ncbi:ABC transporter substrate-binding protein [Brevibacterium sp. UCMA 11754]|uniref:ABC transporter substrate-binding protein n=1 Tax=Brevibacterium sp. UCMA 11754 TaxID=2749198 RepID=UPI001F1D0B74|nr:ABC transporter substrate-binding protein [Brevibacterium sp. UCMA 11754]MCF2571329.1 ABC transporter substrate-binding protein [Brevibacterium sp. UCMA 11754]
MKTPRVSSWMAAVVASSLFLAGCSAGASDSGEQAKKDSMTIAFTAEPVNLDFTSTSGIAIPEALMENVYESLVRVDGEGEIQPGLAEDWDVSEDRKTYTFHLQKGVKFSNGADLTSEDVKFSYERVQNDWKNALKSKMDVVDSIATPDDLTVKISLKKPSNTWLFNMTSLVGAVFDAEGTDDLANEAIGTGPFAIEKFSRGQSIDFAARDDYWGEKPAVSKVQFKYFKDAVSASNALKSGEIDVVSNLQAPELAGEFQSSDYQIISGTTNGEVVLSMNNAKGIFKDKKAREAVMHAIDRKAVLDTAWAGYGELIGSMVPPTDPYYEDLTKVWDYDPAKAKDLVREAGIEGETFAFTVPNLPYAKAISEIVSAQLAEVGLKADIETQEFPAVWLDKTFTEHKFDMSVINHAEPRDILTVFSNDYYIGYDDSKTKKIAEKADTGTEEEYVSGMKEIAKTITEDAASDFLFLFPNLVIAKSDVAGIPANRVSDSFRIADLSWN